MQPTLTLEPTCYFERKWTNDYDGDREGKQQEETQAKVRSSCSFCKICEPLAPKQVYFRAKTIKKTFSHKELIIEQLIEARHLIAKSCQFQTSKNTNKKHFPEEQLWDRDRSTTNAHHWNRNIYNNLLCSNQKVLTHPLTSRKALLQERVCSKNIRSLNDYEAYLTLSHPEAPLTSKIVWR